MMNMKSGCGAAFAIVVGILCLVVPGARAQSTWNGLGSDSNWSTAQNWAGAVAPVSSTTTAIQMAGGTRVASTVDTPFSLASLTFNSGAGAFTLSGSTISLDGTNNYTAAIVTKTSSLITIGNNITLLNASAIGNASGGGSMTLNGSISENGNSLGLVSNVVGQTITVNGGISGSSQVTFNGNAAGIIAMNGSSSYTGTTSIYSTIVEVGTNVLTNTNGALGNSAAAIQLGAAAGGLTASLLTSGGYTISRGVQIVSHTSGTANTSTIGGSTAAASTYSGDITLGSVSAAAEALTVTAVSGGTVTVSGNVVRASGATGSGDNVTKSGAGTVVFSGAANSYLGTTTVSAGTLLVDGTLASGGGAVSVSSGATLGGSGTIGRAVTVSGGATLSAGDGGIGTLTTGDLTLGSTSTLAFDLGAPSVGDTVAVNGNLTLAGTLKLTNVGGMATGDYSLFTYTGVLSYSPLSMGTVPSGFTYSIDTSSAGTVYLDVTAVPEPGILALCLCGGFVLLGGRAGWMRVAGTRVG